MKSFSSRIGLPLGKVLVVVAVAGFGLIGCGGSSSSPGGSSPVAAVTPLVTVTPVSNTLTAGATVSVVVAVSGGSGTPAGSVVLSSGSYASFATTLVSGSATIAVPTGLLVTGSDTLTAAYTPGSASVGTYNSASGTGSVTVQGTAVAPTVTASAVTYPTTGAAFDVLPLSNGSALVAVPSGVQVFVPAAGGGLTASCIDTLGATLTGQGGAVSELSLLPGGVDLAAGIGSPGAAFFNLAQAQSCAATPTVVSQGTIASAQGTQAVAVTADGKYAFVSNEYGVVSGATTEGNVGVVQLAYDSNGNVTSGSTLLGQISTGGQAVAGMLLSPDGTRLYVTSEIVGTTAAQGGSNPVLARTGCVQAAGGTPQANGTLTVINVAKAESAPGAGAIVATVDAGCSPVRMAETADGNVLWVAARGDNRVLAFSTGMLEANAGNALVGYAGTGGTAPVGIALFSNDRLLAVANSNRFGGGTANATVLFTTVPATASVVQTVSTGLFPREVRLGPDGATLFLTNYNSDSLEVITTVVK